MPSEAADITFIASECAFALLLLCLCNCHYPNPETTALPPPAAPARMPAVRLRYFPYSTVGRRASENQLVCAICLDVFEHGESCGEVPACRHFFHGACVDVWRKSSVTCPLCRGYMAATGSSERVSAADDMV